MTAAEASAVRVDAALRLGELQAVREVLLPDIDDAEVLSEIVVVEGQIRACEQALTDEPEGNPR
jgi:hypothetical protein